MSPKNFALVVLACLVKGAFYADAAPSISRDELTAETNEHPKSNPTTDQIETPLIDYSSTSTTEHDLQLAKGPLSGIVGGGGGETTSAPATNTPAAGYLGGSTFPFGGLPTGIPGAGSLSQGDSGSSPTLILGGFSVVVVPLRGMSLGNMASMLSAGQQLGQMVPKPGGG